MISVLMVLAGLLWGPSEMVPAVAGSEYGRIIDGANFNFANELFYKDQAKWIGQTVAVKGSFSNHPDYSDIGKPYEIISGTGNNGMTVVLLALLDHPVASTESFTDHGPRVTKGEELRYFGILRKARETVMSNGVIRILPVFEVQLIFRSDDQTYEKPIWVSKSVNPQE